MRSAVAIRPSPHTAGFAPPPAGKGGGARAAAVSACDLLLQSDYPCTRPVSRPRLREERGAAALQVPRDTFLSTETSVLRTDPTTREIYSCAERDHINSWLRTLAQIRQWPTTWPTRWFRPDTP